MSDLGLGCGFLIAAVTFLCAIRLVSCSVMAGIQDAKDFEQMMIPTAIAKQEE